MSREYDEGVQDGSQRAVSDVLDVIDEHIPSMSDKDEEEINVLAYDDNADAADLAIRTCHCGKTIDGFYEYVEHLKSAIRRAMVV
jgi:hypothetical protein